MKYSLFIALIMLPVWCRAQAAVTGLGNYIIGKTTTASLDRGRFLENDQSVVKGTIALPCVHIRVFTSAAAEVSGVSVANIVLAFYDDTLFQISCDYRDPLTKTFAEHHGPGVAAAISRSQPCTSQPDKPLMMWSESWSGAAIQAHVVHGKGFLADCQPVDRARLTITSQTMAALSSDCELKPADPLIEAFTNLSPENSIKQR